MKKFLSVFCLISVLFTASFSALAQGDLPDGSATYNSKDSAGQTVCGTVYDLSVYQPTIVSDESQDSQLSLDDRVALRSKNAIVVQIGNYATVGHDALKWIDSANKNVKPYIKSDRTMVPLRYIAEELGAIVDFNDATREVSISLKGDVFKVVIGADSYNLNGNVFKLDAPAEITEDRTFVPLRVISEAFGMSVTWLESNRIVVITPANYPWDENNKIEKETLSRFNLLLSPLVRDIVNQ